MSDYISLADALTQLAALGGWNVADLSAYAGEDGYGGRDTGDFQAMAIHAVEGRLLYALVRALHPARVLEIGTADGGSATHILAALAKNEYGELVSYDLVEGVGEHIPAALRDRWTLHIGDAMEADYPYADLIFEDSAHTLDFSVALYLKLKALNPRVIGTHDYNTQEVYPVFAVKDAFDAVFPGNLNTKLNDAFTGLAFWVNPDWKAPEVEAEEALTEFKANYDAGIATGGTGVGKAPSPPRKAAPARKPRAKKAAVKK